MFLFSFYVSVDLMKNAFFIILSIQKNISKKRDLPVLFLISWLPCSKIKISVFPVSEMWG